MSIADLLHVLRRHLTLLIVLPVLGMLAAGLMTLRATPLYRATASVYFSLPYGNSAVDLSQGSTYAQGQMESFAVLARSPAVLDKVAKALPFPSSAGQLSGAIGTSSEAGTVILKISATDASPSHAALIAEQTANQLRTAARALSPKDSKDAPTVDVTTIGHAKVPTVASSPRPKRNLAIGLLAGIVLAVAWAMLREKLDTKVRSGDELPASLPVLGAAYLPKGSRPYVAVVDQPRSVGAEQFRRLRTNLLFTRDGEESATALMVTSPCSEDGKSTVAVNLACAFAEAGQRVLLIDADLRRPSIADKLNLEGAVGLSTVLSGQAPFEEVVQPMGGDSSLDVLASGAVPPNPAQLLESARMHGLMESVRAIYDIVIVDGPPLLAVTDAALVSPLTSGCVLVVRQGKTHQRDVAEALSGLANIDTTVLGVILSRREPRFRRTGTYTYGNRRAAGHRSIGGLVRGRSRQRDATQDVGSFR